MSVAVLFGAVAGNRPALIRLRAGSFSHPKLAGGQFRWARPAVPACTLRSDQCRRKGSAKLSHEPNVGAKCIRTAGDGMSFALVKAAVRGREPVLQLRQFAGRGFQATSGEVPTAAPAGGEIVGRRRPDGEVIVDVRLDWKTVRLLKAGYGDWVVDLARCGHAPEKHLFGTGTPQEGNRYGFF